MRLDYKYEKLNASARKSGPSIANAHNTHDRKRRPLIIAEDLFLLIIATMVRSKRRTIGRLIDKVRTKEPTGYELKNEDLHKP